MKPEITRWQTPPHNATLQRGELHLWRFNLDCSIPIFNQLKKLLDREEILRADRLLDLQKKKQFVAARGRLKEILGCYQKTEPKQIKFQYNEYGKPSLAELYHSSLSFNLSHSETWAVLAVVDGFAVGIDLEKIDADINYTPLAHQFFNDREKCYLEKYPTQRRRRGFYRLWTRKEAMLKLNGLGFSNTIQTIESSIAAGWYLKSFPLLSDCICSIATEEKIIIIKKFHI